MNGFELGIDGDLDDNQFTWNRGELTGPGTTKLTADRSFSVALGHRRRGARSTQTDTTSRGTADSFGSGLGDSEFGYTGAGTIEQSPPARRSRLNLPASGQSDIVNGGEYRDPQQFRHLCSGQQHDAVHLSGALNNNGTVALNAGTLVARNGGSNNGAFTGSGTLVLAGGTHISAQPRPSIRSSSSSNPARRH